MERTRWCGYSRGGRSPPNPVRGRSEWWPSQIGITPSDLIATIPECPTFAHTIPQLRLTLTPGTLRTYHVHLDRLENTRPNQRLDEVTVADLDRQARDVQASSRINRSSRDGTGAREHFVNAVRCLYRYAENNNWIQPHRNPARQLTIPTRQPSHRRAIPLLT
ncbi:hypothetical protein [Nocardia sp. A7]|uniref:hypothetical protein n=1 Tax=Nocardia sp. A7 TaxID=2789274 RepID=UPI00397C5AD3